MAKGGGDPKKKKHEKENIIKKLFLWNPHGKRIRSLKANEEEKITR